MNEEGTTEMISFMLILSLIIAVIGVVTAVYLPLYLEEVEMAQTNEALEGFLAFNNDITTLCLSGEPGMSRKTALPEANLFQDARLSLTYDTQISYKQKTYRELVVTYERKNCVTDDFTISLSNRGIRVNDAPCISASLNIVVDSADTSEQIESDAGLFWIEYTYLGNFAAGGTTWYIVSVRLR